MSTGLIIGILVVVGVIIGVVIWYYVWRTPTKQHFIKTHRYTRNIELPPKPVLENPKVYERKYGNFTQIKHDYNLRDPDERYF
jgi:hypothetical protein